MKIFKILMFTLFIGVSAQAQFKSAAMQAAGLTCAMCSKAVGEALKQLPFVESVKPEIKSSLFNIKFKPGAQVDPDAVKQAVEDAGFSVAKLRLTGNFDNVKLEKDTHVNIDGKTFHFINAASQTLNGEKTITVVDKSFVPAKDFKKYAAASTMACVQTGKAAACCPKEGRVYHVVI